MQVQDKLRLIIRLAELAIDYDEVSQSMLDAIAQLVPSAKEENHPTPDELFEAKTVGKIPAIKMYRARTNQGLKESKDTLELAMNKLGIPFFNMPF